MKTIKLVLAWVVVLVVIIFAAYIGSTLFKMTRERFGNPAAEVNAVRYVTLHHTTWCPACKVMAPVWQEVKRRMVGRPIMMVENDEEKNPTEGVDGYPTIYLLDEYGKRYQYHGGAEVAQLMQFILAPARGAINN